MALGENSTYVRLEFADVELGVPLQTPLYDGNRRVLLKRGESIETVHELEDLILRGLYRNTSERSSHLLGILAATPSSATRERSSPASSAPEQSMPSAAAVQRDAITTLDAAKLRIGDPLYLQSSPEAPRLVSKLIGHLKNKGLIVTVPESESELIMLRDGQSFIVRFFSGQNAYAFTTAVVKQTSVPYPHVHLSYPKEVRGREIRKGSRVDVDLIAAVAVEEGGAYTGSGKIVNLSISGGALRAKTRLGERDHVINVKFKILIGDMPSYVAVDCVIRAISEDADPSGMPWLHGLQFLNPEPAMALALTAFVYQKIVGET
ncbi:flagellar brake protein [Azonexus sp.]|uniref:flagellar brake protein n=1 Tax=Azonexus sp. TaxID=1872668 RepID=UPI0027B8C2DD|nr:flagellar brake protein [Azonexus sp.]